MRRVLRLRRLLAPSVLLAIGLGVAASAWSLQRALTSAALPYPAANRLVTLIAGSKSWSGPMFDAVGGRTSVFDALSMVQERAATFESDGEAEVIRIESVSSSYFELLGTGAVRGRTFGAADDRRDVPGAGVVISDALWQRRFSASPDVLGRSIDLDRHRLVVVGVMPRGFRGLIGRTDVWIPLGTSRWIDGATGPERPWSRGFEVFGRVRAGIELADAEARYEAEGRAAIESTGAADRILGASGRLRLVSLAAARVPPSVASTTRVLGWASLTMLGFVGVAVTSLALLRASHRAHDIRVRVAIGATRTQIARLALGEAATVAALATIGALVLRPLLLAAVMSIRPESTSFGIVTSELTADGVTRLDVWTVAAAAIGAAIGGLPAALAILWQARRERPVDLRGGRVDGGLAHWRSPAAGLIVVQAAIACLVLTGALLMMRATSQLFNADRGYDWTNVTTARVSLPDDPDATARAAAFYELVVAHLTAMPGIEQASVSSCAPGAGRCRQSNVMRVDGRELGHDAQLPIGITFVTTRHLQTIGATITRGRGFDANDRRGAPAVALVSELLAARLWPGADPIGRTLEIFTANGSLAGARMVVGVIRPIRFGIDDDDGGDVFLPAAQVAWTSGVVFAKSRLPAHEVYTSMATAIAAVDRRVPVHDPASLEDRLGRSVGAELFLLRTLTVFGAAGLVLAAIGAYTTTAHAVARSRREIAVRIALGAAPGRIWSLVGRRGLVVGLTGATAGVAGALFVGQLLASLLHGVSARDPIAFALAPCVTVCCLVLSVALPAWRASRLSPTAAMHEP